MSALGGPFRNSNHPTHGCAGAGQIGYVSPCMPSTGAAELEALSATLTAKTTIRPTVGVVLGSGLGAFGDQLEMCVPYRELPGMPTSNVPGHANNLRMGRIDGVAVACLQGRVHLYEGYDAGAVVFGVRLLDRLGCKAVILTNAAGGIAPGLHPGDRMLITDHLNLTARNPLVGLAGDTALGFVDMGAAHDRRLGELCRIAARETHAPVKEGVYAGVVGPSYETPAEIRMLRTLGADAVGMSTVLEVVALRHAGVRVCAISCITNLAAGISPVPLDHREVQDVARKTAAPLVALLARLTALIGSELSA
jgi:purine-nucleoside phosphorylase